MAQAPAHPLYGSDLVVEVLRALGVPYVAMNSGSSFKWLQDSLVNYAANRPQVLHCTHEEVSIAIAHGYAKATGRPLAALTHNVVGLQHASMAIYNAWCDRAPVLVLGGTGPLDATTRRPWIDWVHTANVQAELVRHYVKWDDQPASLAAIPESLLQGYRLALAQPQGPVYLCFDASLQAARLQEEIAVPDPTRYPPPSTIAPDPDALRTLARWLVEARAPVVLADYVGVSPEAVDALVELADLLALPVCDRGGRFNFPTNHPLDLTGAQFDLLREADLVLALELRDVFAALHARSLHQWSPTPFIGPECRVASLSLWGLRTRGWVQDSPQRLVPLDLDVVADPRTALPLLLEECRRLLGRRSPAVEARRDALARRHQELRAHWQQEAARRWRERPIAVARLAGEVWEAVRGEDWVLGNGDLAGWTRRLWEYDRPYRWLGGSGGGGLGYGVGAALGAALAHKGSGRLVVDLQPDGDLLYTASALWTAAHHRIPLLVVMFNNRTYNNSEDHAIDVATQRDRSTETRGIGVWMKDPPVDFARLAQSQGWFALGPIEDPDAIAPALREAVRVVLREGAPALVDVVTQNR